MKSLEIWAEGSPYITIEMVRHIDKWTFKKGHVINGTTVDI
jgi:hypothetical protein